MAKTQGINPFDLSNYSTGGSIIPAGRYIIVTACYTMYDFGGKAKEDQLMQLLEIQPLNAKGKADGDTLSRYLSLGQGIIGINPINGKKGCWSGLELDPDFEFENGKKPMKLFGESDQAFFMKSLAEHQYDMDQDNDITCLEGLDLDLDVIEIEYKKKKDTTKSDAKPGKDAKPEKTSHPVIVCTGINSTDGKPAAKKEVAEEEDEKPAKSSKSSKSDDGDGDSDDPADILTRFCKTNLCVKANAKEGIDEMPAKVELRNWLRSEKVDTATQKSVLALFADEKAMGKTIRAFDWQNDGGTFKPND